MLIGELIYVVCMILIYTCVNNEALIYKSVPTFVINRGKSNIHSSCHYWQLLEINYSWPFICVISNIAWIKDQSYVLIRCYFVAQNNLLISKVFPHLSLFKTMCSIIIYYYG